MDDSNINSLMKWSERIAFETRDVKEWIIRHLGESNPITTLLVYIMTVIDIWYTTPIMCLGAIYTIRVGSQLELLKEKN